MSLVRISAAAEEERRRRGAKVFVIFVNVSMGSCLPRLLGYRSQLGMVFIPIVGEGGTAIVDEISNEALLAKHVHDVGG